MENVYTVLFVLVVVVPFAFWFGYMIGHLRGRAQGRCEAYESVGIPTERDMMPASPGIERTED